MHLIFSKFWLQALLQQLHTEHQESTTCTPCLAQSVHTSVLGHSFMHITYISVYR